MQRIVHIGLHKTASSFLQRFYFPSLLNTNVFSHKLSKLSESELKRNIIISEENLSGKPWNEKWINGNRNDYSWFKSFENSIEIVDQIFTNDIILVFFRRHGDLIYSLYKQYLHEGGVLKFDQFYSSTGVISDQDLNMKKRIMLLNKKFQNVDILIFEEFKYHGDIYLDKYFKERKVQRSKIRISKVVNPGVSGRKMEYLRKSNVVYNSLPQLIKNLLIKTNFTPLKIFRNRLGFWKAKDSTSTLKKIEQINNRFSEDWKFVMENSWKFSEKAEV